MEIVTGLFDRMVLQRNRQGVCDAAITGKSGSNGKVEVRVQSDGKTVRGYNWVRVGSAAKGRFEGRIKGLAAGGPYEVELRVVDSKGGVAEEMKVSDVLVGDVWILGGQSNMEGIGREYPPIKTDKLVRAFYMDDRWAAATDPIHNLAQAVDQVHTDLGGGDGRPKGSGRGPGVPFGHEMRRLTGVPQGLISCAHGGTSMDQWDPRLKKLGGRSLFGATVRRFVKNGGKVAGVIWYQGCSDTGPEACKVYTLKMKRLVAAFRKEFGDSRLPFVMVQIARVVASGTASRFWNDVQEQQRRLPEVIDRLAVVPAIDLEIDDLIHIGGFGQIRLGKRLAEATAALTGMAKDVKPPIAVKGMKMGPGFVRVRFDHVVGKLIAAGRPSGFDLSDLRYEAIPSIFRIDLEGNEAVLRTCLQDGDISNLAVHYGYGVDPYCNITDEADRSLPVFGPLPLGTPRPITPFVRTMRISDIQGSAGKLGKLGCPDTSDRKLGWRRHTFPGDFAERRAELAARAPQDVLIHYALGFRCAEKMKLAIWLGYDGPVKVWMDGRRVFHDPEGTNPALWQDGRIEVSASAGDHELVISLGSNEGKAWGVFLRMERLGVPKRLLDKGADAVAMPEFIE
ncbi:MAG: sialate O-acetylesterase [Phycisphaerae bacterium]|nr:sialate O-acetylesterase [Phycisphaerae bacterium]